MGKEATDRLLAFRLLAPTPESLAVLRGKINEQRGAETIAMMQANLGDQRGMDGRARRALWRGVKRRPDEFA